MSPIAAIKLKNVLFSLVVDSVDASREARIKERDRTMRAYRGRSDSDSRHERDMSTRVSIAP